MSEIYLSKKSGLNGLISVFEEIIPHLNSVHIFLLQGDLGSGKTTFCKFLLKQLGVETEITSPTFNLVNEYINGNGEIFYHFDLYRIRHIDELSEIGFYEYLYSGKICLIEWPEIIEPYLKEPYLKLKIEYGEKEREYTLTSKAKPL